MSYPPLPDSGYGNYYNNAHPSSSATFNSSREPGNNGYSAPHPYQTDVGQGQQVSSGYDWQQQNQTIHSQDSQTFGNESYRHSKSQSNSYDYRKEVSNIATQAAAGNRASQYFAHSLSTTSAQNTQGLDNLAYASGLDNSGTGRQGSRGSQNKTSSTGQRNTTSFPASQNRVSSPAQNPAPQYKDQATLYNANSMSDSNAGQNLAISAAAALAGAVSRRYPNGTVSEQQKSASIAEATKQNTVTSAYQQLNPSKYMQKQQPQYHTVPAKPQISSRSSNNPVSRVISPINVKDTPSATNQSQIRTTQHSRAPSQPSQDQQRPTPQQVSSISNLVDNFPQAHNQSTSSPTIQQQPMPSYIDPSQVFNPYHKEHERRKREAAQAEADARRREAGAEMERKEAEAEVKRNETEAEAKRKESEDIARRREAQAGKKAKETPKQTMVSPARTSKNLNGGKVVTNSQVKPSAPGSKMKSPEEDGMAAEMRMMMEKMKEFRNKDPTLFSKLLDEMKKGGTGSSTNPHSTQTSPPQVQQSQLQGNDGNVVNTIQTLPSNEGRTQHAHTSQPSPIVLPQKSPAPRTPSLQGGNANGYRVVVEHNPEALPGLGRFPAERRIRPGKKREYSLPPTPETATSNLPVNVASTSQPNLAAPSLNFSLNGTPPISIQQTAPVQQQQTKPPPGVVIWPEEKRTALIEAAIKTLKAIPENSPLSLDPSDLEAILNQNPSYIELCEMLERKDFKFHRAYFARQLLNKIPELVGPQTPAPTTPEGTSRQPDSQMRNVQQAGAGLLAASREPIIETTPPSVLQQSQLPPASIRTHPSTSLPAPAAGGTGGNLAQTQGGPPRVYVTHNVYHPQGTRPMVQVTGPLSGPPHWAPHHAAPIPANPREFHLFGVRVANTAVKPNKGRVSSGMQVRNGPLPGVKEAMARKRDFSELVDLTQLSDSDDYVLSNKHPRSNSPSPEPDYMKSFRAENKGIATSTQILKPTEPLRFNASQSQHQSGVVVPSQPLPAQSQSQPQPQPRVKTILAKRINFAEASRKSFYDPKTVARDILIAAGRHPTERPLNAHLAALLSGYIDLESDLSTFDWNAVDPGGPPMPKVEYIDIPAGPPRFGFKQGVLGEKGKRSESEGISRLPQKDKPNSAAVTVPTLSRFAAQSKQLLQDSIKLKQEHQQLKLKITQNVSDLDRAVTPQKRKASVISVDLSPVSNSQPKRSISQSQETQSNSAPTDRASTERNKRRGRPLGSKNKGTPLSEMRQAAKAEPRIEVLIPSLSTPTTHRVYKCRWIKCQAKLHNFSTLRKHVEKLHRPNAEEVEEHRRMCWWKDCQYFATDEEGKLSPTHQFPTHEEWMQHIQEDHLHAIGLKYGDGPSTTHIGKPNPPTFDVSRFLCKSPQESKARTVSYLDSQSIAQDRTRYLSDEQGRATTPKLSMNSNKDLPADTLVLTKAHGEESDIVAHRSFLKAHRTGKAGPMTSAEETLRAMTARKAKIGPGIDRGGCILVNDARRATLVQNQGLARIVDADY